MLLELSGLGLGQELGERRALPAPRPARYGPFKSRAVTSPSSPTAPPSRPRGEWAGRVVPCAGAEGRAGPGVAMGS